MDFRRPKKMGKRGATGIASSMTELMLTVILIGVFSVVVIAIIIAFAPLVQSQAETASTAATDANNTVVASLWNILAEDNVVEILMVTVYIILVVVVLVGIITKATKSIK